MMVLLVRGCCGRINGDTVGGGAAVDSVGSVEK
jgi:hypothetical protein